jgi:hypothetical protein
MTVIINRWLGIISIMGTSKNQITQGLATLGKAEFTLVKEQFLDCM